MVLLVTKLSRRELVAEERPLLSILRKRHLPLLSLKLELNSDAIFQLVNSEDSMIEVICLFKLIIKVLAAELLGK